MTRLGRRARLAAVIAVTLAVSVVAAGATWGSSSPGLKTSASRSTASTVSHRRHDAIAPASLGSTEWSGGDARPGEKQSLEISWRWSRALSAQ